MTSSEAQRRRRQLSRIAAHIKVAAAGCWLWQASVDSAGIPRLVTNGLQIAPHRVAFMYLRRPLRHRETLRVTCGDRKCIRPSCMRVIRPAPAPNPRRKLRAADVLLLRQARAVGTPSIASLAGRLGVSLAVAYQAAHAVTYRDVLPLEVSA